MLPEVIFLSEFIDVIGGNMHIIQPDIISLLIIDIDRGIQSLRIQSDTLRKELPCPGNRLLLEIIAKGKIAKHFKICTMSSSLSDILEVTGTNTLLTGCYSPSRRNLLPRKPWLHRCHTGIDDQKRVIIVRNQRKAVESQTSLLFKKLRNSSRNSLTPLYCIVFIIS